VVKLIVYQIKDGKSGHVSLSTQLILAKLLEFKDTYMSATETAALTDQNYSILSHYQLKLLRISDANFCVKVFFAISLSYDCFFCY